MVATKHREVARLHDNELLKSYMRRNDWTVRTLADEVDFRLRRSYKKREAKDSTAPSGCGRGTIGNLSSGYRTTVHPDTAQAICDVFDIPMRGLFLTTNFNVQREVEPKRRAA